MTFPKDKVKPMSRDHLDALAAQMGLTLINFPSDLMDNELLLKQLHEFYHACFKDNAHFHPISYDKYKQLTEKLLSIVDFDISFIVMDNGNKPVSILVSYKDIYHEMFKTKKRMLFMKTLSTVPEWRSKGLSQALVNYGCVIAPSLSYDQVVFATMWVDNATAAFTRDVFGSATIHSYGLFSKNI